MHAEMLSFIAYTYFLSERMAWIRRVGRVVCGYTCVRHRTLFSQYRMVRYCKARKYVQSWEREMLRDWYPCHITPAS
jgi:hypothetical protein